MPNYFCFGTSLGLLKTGHRVARKGFTKTHRKWVRLNPGGPGVMSHLELYYPPGDGPFSDVAVPWLPSRCDLLENDWFHVSDE